MADRRIPQGTSAEEKKSRPRTPAKNKVQKTAFTLAEVQSFIYQHQAGKAINLPGRTADDIGTIHEAYNRSTYKYAENILALLAKWANN